MGCRVIEKGRKTSFCLLVDVSAGGACLQFGSTRADFGDAFSVKIDKAPPRDCRVRWRAGSKVGVQFV